MRAKLMAAVAAVAILSVAGFQARAAEGLLGVTLVQGGGQVVISSVLSGSSAEQVGLRPGDVLAKVGTVNISTINDALYAKQIAPEGVDIPMVIYTQNGPWFINARFGGGTVFYTLASDRPAGGGRPMTGGGNGNPRRP